MAEPAGWRFTGDYERGPDAPSPGPADEAAPELAPGLELLGPLGQGGFAVVHRARERASGREVALKVLRSDRAGNPLSRARFLREGALAARLDHEGIVRVHAAGTFQGQPCLVLELVQGTPLAEALPGLPRRRRLELVRELAAALGYAHARGVVHRDVKPDNVLVDQRGRARLADFGLAAAEDLERLTRSGAVLGTPFYMSPEQLTGGRGVSPASDVWALGVILYLALTDRLPFQAESLATLAAEVHAAAWPAPRALRPDVDPDLEAVCLRALQVEPEARYPDGTALAADLEAVLRGERPPGARPLAAPGRWLLLLVPLALAAGLGLLRQTAPALPAPPAAGDTPDASRRPASPGDPLGALLPLLHDRLPPRERARALAAWLEAHGAHRRAGDARLALEAACGRAPLLQLGREGAPNMAGRGLFLGQELVTWQGGVLRRVDRDGRVLRRWDPVGVREGLALPDGGLLLAAYRDAVVAFDPPGGEALHERFRADCPGWIEHLALDPARGVFAVGVGDEVRLFALADGAARERFGFEGRPVRALAFSPVEGRLVAAAGEVEPPPVLRAWSLDARGACREAWSQEGPAEGGSALAFSPDGRLLALGTRAHQLLLLDPASGTVEGMLRGEVAGDDPLALVAQVAHETPVQALAFSPDGARLYSLGSRAMLPPGELRVWDVAARTQHGATLPLPDHAPSELVLDAPGERLLIGCQDGAVLVWAAPE